jgi:hypothetical protein
MKRDKLFSGIWAFLFAFAVSWAATMCVVTAFDFMIDTSVLIDTCFWTALVCSVCYTLPLGLVPVGAGAAILGYLWQNGTLEASLEAFLNRLTRQYDRAYGWGIIRWSHRVADEMEPDLVFMVCILGAVIALLTAWVVCRRKTVLPALFVIFLTVATCFVVNDTVPDTPWLYLLLLCVILLLLTGSVRRQDEKQGNRLCLWLTPVTALALLCLFAAIPRESYTGQATAKQITDAILQSDSMQLLMGHVDENSSVTGDTDANAVNLRSVGYRVESHAQILQVNAPYTGTVYLRSRAMDLYDGTSWKQSENDYQELYWPADLESMGEMTISTRFAHRMLYTPYYITVSDVRDISTGMPNEKSLTEYSFSCRRSPQIAELSSMTMQWPNLNDYIQMDDSVRQWTEPVVKQIRRSNQTVYQTAQVIASYVRNSALYNTRTPRMPADSKDFAQWFLENSETGYCVHFATATTVLLQAAGIPARYVTGYMAQVTEGETVTVYSDQAHAWTEYWLPGFGWTVLESTPSDDTTDPEQIPEETTAATVPQTTAGAVPDESVTTSPDMPTPDPMIDRGLVLWMLLGMASLCAAVTVAEGQRKLRLRLRQKQINCAKPNQKALLYWQMTTVYARLLKETPDLALYRLAEMAKFSQHTVTDDQLAQFEAYLQDAVQRLKQRNIFCRLYYRFILAIY